jgi:hypothetical protein
LPLIAVPLHKACKKAVFGLSREEGLEVEGSDPGVNSNYGTIDKPHHHHHRLLLLFLLLLPKEEESEKTECASQG